MKRYTKRLCALWLCAAMLWQLLPALAEEAEIEEAVVPITQSQSVKTQDGVVVTGERAAVDFAWLSTITDHCVGWLYQEETAYSKPVMQGKDNNYFKNRGFGGYNVGTKGLPFLDAYVDPAMTDPVFRIYGSAREDGGLEIMREYREPAYYDAHPSFRLMTPTGDWQAEVFACVKTYVRNVDKWGMMQEGETRSDWIRRVVEGSEIIPIEGTLPGENEQIVIFTALLQKERRDMVFATLRPIRYETDKTVDLNKTGMDTRATESGWVEIPGLGKKMVYAQNDSIWGRMRYESEKTSKFRRFEGGACGPTAAAIAIANLVEPEELPKIREYAGEEGATLFCACSVNRVYCNHLHPPYRLEGTAEEYLRYLPVIMGDFAAGNNRWGVNSRPAKSVGSNMRFLEPLCEVYGLTMETFRSVSTAIDHMKARGNRGILLCCAVRGSPFTNTSHFVAIAGADDTYFYVLDPLFRTDYSDCINADAIDAILQPGVVRIRLEDLRSCSLSVVGYLEKKAE